MYVDDGKTWVSSESLLTNVRILARAYKKIDRWLISVGLSPDLVKRELQHYTRRRNDDCPPIPLPGKDGGIVFLTASKTVKWLGIHFDRKLRFDEHVKKLAARAQSAVNGLCMLANTVRGLSQSHLRTLYLSCVLPILSYG
ncbi:hypothetical protein DFH06DRAFT_996803, partial [Mycena polygramma]